MFLSCGDALFDLFAEAGDDPASLVLNGRVGGSPLNVALGLARLGHPVGYLTKMSRDVFGQRIRAFMAREGIDDALVVDTTRNTTLATVSLAEDGSASYAFHIDGTADRSLEPSDVPDRLPDAVEAIHVASYATVTEPTASTLAAMLERESARRFVSYDPNIRAAIEPDLDLWRARVAATLPHAALVKASTEDLELLYPQRSLDAVMADWLDAGASLAVITRGEAGAIAANGAGTRVERPGVRVETIDTVGAGDTFQAALLAGLAETGSLSRQTLADADADALGSLVDFAIRAAAITCSRRGADLPRRADLGLAPLA